MTTPTDELGYSSEEVLRMTGCTYRQLDYWLTTSRIRGLDGENPGSGIRRFIGRNEVAVIRAVLRLLNVGFTLDKAFAYGRQLVETGEPVIVDGVTIGGA